MPGPRSATEEKNTAAVLSARDGHPLRWRRVLQRVVEQVANDPSHVLLLGPHRRDIRIDAPVDPAAVMRSALTLIDELLYQRGGRQELRSGSCARPLDAGGEQQVLD